jgi:hypothetical protein
MYGEVVRWNFINLVRAYAEARGISITGVSNEHYGNGVFLREFIAGKKTTSIDRLGEMLADIAATWPPDTPWPSELLNQPWTRQSLLARKEILRPGHPVPNRLLSILL